ERPPLQAIALAAKLPYAASQRVAAPCGLATGVAYASRHHPCRHQPCPRAIAHAGGCPCKGLWSWPAATLAGGLGRNQLPLVVGLVVGGRPCMGVGNSWPPLLLTAFTVKTQQECVEQFYAIQSHHTQLKINLSHENLGSDTTIQMEKIKEVKRPPLWRYPHDGSFKRSSSNLISQLLHRGREENKRWWLKL
ncbi:hypothetical protein GW17_00054361, partial [Ensete ventricosum]